MKQINVWQKQSRTIDPRKAGYSDVRLWPCYLLGSGAILLLGPFFHPLLLILTVIIPAYVFAKRAAQIESTDINAKIEFNKFHDRTYIDVANSDRLFTFDPLIANLLYFTKIHAKTRLRKTSKLRYKLSIARQT